MIKRNIFLTILCLSLAIALTGCFKYESQGTVMMDKFVSLNTLWANKDAYIGKVVTISWGRVYLGTTGYTGDIGKDQKGYNFSSIYTNANGYTNYEKEFLLIYDSLAHIAVANGDSILPGDYEVYFCYSQYNLKNNPIPDWAEYKGPHLPEYDVNLFKTRKEKYVTGVLVDVLKSTSKRGFHTKAYYIIPIGYRVSKTTY